MLKIGVFGAGHLGKIHIKCIRLVEGLELTGFFDPDPDMARAAEAELGATSFPTAEALIAACDIVDIVSTTISHYECATLAMKQSKHVFIEKPITTTLEECGELINIAREANVKVQVGHVERFNPAFIAAKPFFGKPMFIETHRLAMFNPRGTDVSVVLDLMIHDIDIILSVVKSNIKKISASGVAVVSDTPDITNARIEFDNGCVANLTASRISMKNMRKSRFFQRDAYISVDFLDKETKVFRLKELEGDAGPFSMTIDLGNDRVSKEIFYEQPTIEASNAIQTELTSFMESILHDKTPEVSIQDGFHALDVALRVMEKVSLHSHL
ncbi:MAG: Gfo/Idh/MocA family oxidoreductase [Bacteroidetes bacterium]|nr:Gfo/Idh/MocA family oxidoreductase [Bacteroidota bacterium]MBU1720572.1 Gfo/Idh/MocA family oxidoreductase [Bacteroidota bacterium]